MKSAVTLLAIVLLGLSAVRLVVLDRAEIQARSDNRAERRLMPVDASLIGITEAGALEAPGPAGIGPLDAKGHLLIFAFRERDAARTVEYWYRVRQIVEGLNPAVGEHMEYWAVCDAGSACRAYQRDAAFPILGYLDPYQMRIVALAGDQDEALLYNGAHTAAVHVPLGGSPQAEAQRILRMVR